jgi:23S rRNA G2445 N2-methylase RlmL
MEHTYFSTFITGFQEVVETSLRQDLKDVKVILTLDGLIVYCTGQSYQKIKSLRYLNNTFLLFKLFSNLNGKLPVEFMMKSLLKDSRTIGKLPSGLSLRKLSFRVITSQENQMVGVNRRLLEKTEQLFKTKLRLNRVDRSKPNIEVWFLWRNEGYGFIGLRLTKTPNYEKTLHKGELRPELANLMCLLSEPSHDDVFLDPFSGYGSIPIERVKTFPYKQVIAGEKDPAVFKLLKGRASRIKRKIVLGHWDALALTKLSDNSVNKIVTDPPWGIFSNKKINYAEMLQEFARTLSPDGLLVVLMGQKELFKTALSKYPNLKVLKKYDTLVSGKKASVYKIKKMRRSRSTL